MIIAVLIILGLCFGSFVNAFVWRLYQQSLPASKQKATKRDLSISTGRSMCVDCGHTLKAIDLLPVLSWVSLGGKCRYCKKPISWQYPLVELITAAAFVASYVWWPQELTGLATSVFALWLAFIVAFMALIIYDVRWMLLPNKIIFPFYGVASVFVLLQFLDGQSVSTLVSAGAGILIGGGIFYILFQISGGTWIGGGDVKLGFLLGALIGGPVSAFLMLFIASLLGSLLAVPIAIKKGRRHQTRIPFGPFLILGAFVVQLFGDRIINAYLAYLGV